MFESPTRTKVDGLFVGRATKVTSLQVLLGRGVGVPVAVTSGNVLSSTSGEGGKSPN
jgi:hypothetical protein